MIHSWGCGSKKQQNKSVGGGGLFFAGDDENKMGLFACFYTLMEMKTTRIRNPQWNWSPKPQTCFLLLILSVVTVIGSRVPHPLTLPKQEVNLETPALFLSFFFFFFCYINFYYEVSVFIEEVRQENHH